MKFVFISMLVLGVSILSSNGALAKDNSKDGICVIAVHSKKKEAFCVAAKAKGDAQGLEKILIKGHSIACHSKQDAKCEKALALADDFLHQADVAVGEPAAPGPVDSTPVVVAEPSDNQASTEVVTEPACDPLADRTCQGRLDDATRAGQKKMAARQPAYSTLESARVN